MAATASRVREPAHDARPLPVVRVDLGEGVFAGFTTRDGGVSSGGYSSLNLGLNVADRRADVLANRALVAAWAGGPVAFATQVHGAEIAIVAAADDELAGQIAAGTIGEFDGLISADGAGVAVLVADCVPVLLADPVAGVVGAVHAGRRGLVANVVQRAVAALVAQGARPGRIRAAIGPAICGRCYEVPDQMRDEVAAVVPAAWATTSWATPALDLPAGVAAVLAGVGVTAVHRLEICTRTDPAFYSHRRAAAGGAVAGRFAGVIRAAGLISGVSGNPR